MEYQRGYRRIARAAWRARIASVVAALVGVSALVALPMGTAAPGDTALDLGSAGAYVTFGDPAKLDLAQFTIETWFKRTGTGVASTTGNGGIATMVPLLTHGAAQAEDSNVDANWVLGINTTGNVIAADFEAIDDPVPTGQNVPISGTTAITSNVWHHAAATFDGTTWAVYLDGNLEASTTPGLHPRSDSIQHAALGAMIQSAALGPTAGRFQGVLDEARVWSVARTGPEILASKNSELTSGTGLVARWGLDEGSGTSVGDSIATAANGTITGSGYSWVVPPGVPGAPTIGTATAGDASAIVSWSAPASNGGSAITGYVVTPYIGASAQTTTTVGNVTSTSVTGLTNGTAYTFRVAAINAVGAGGQSANSNPVMPVAGDAALDLGSAGAYVTFGDPAKLDLAQFTIETWFKRTGAGTPNTTGGGGITVLPLLTHGAPQAENSNVDANWILGLRTDGATPYVLAADFEEGAAGTSPGLNHPITGTTVVPINEWHHAAATYGAGTWRLYLDGNLEATLAVNQPPRSDTVQGAGLGTMIPVSSFGPPVGRFQGVLDEARVWDHARSGADILASKNAELTSGSGLVARWGLDEGTSTLVGDSIATAANGTVTGSGYSWGAGFVPPAAGNQAPSAPTLNAPANAATGVSTSPTLDVGVSDPNANALTVTYFGRPFASGNYAQIAQHNGVASGTGDTVSWPNLGAGQTFQWFVTVSDGSLTTTGPTWTFHTASADPVFVGAGDIADCGRPQDEATAAVIGGVDGAVWTAGDNVYPTGTLANFTNCYEPSWGGAIKARTRPVPGNHDWGTGVLDSLAGYNAYYGTAATDGGGKSYYSYDIPSSNWHVVNLDSECQLVPGGVSGDGCAANSAQEQWLELDLAANSGENVIAIWHKPRYSSGVTNYQALQPLWDDLYAAGVDILLVGHDHIYERLAPMKSGATLSSPPVADAAFGIRQFTVGTGGAAAQSCGTLLATSQACNNSYGVMKLTLHASTYDWAFLPIAGSTFTDSGTGTVHGAPATVPGAPSIGTATAGNASATVTWSAPASNGGSAITGYVVTPFIGAVAQTPTPVGNVSTTPITGLNNGTSYTFRVAAVNAVGTGAQSADSNPVTPVAPATVPGAPSIGTATAGNASATVTWSAPASNGGSAITGYVVTPFIGAVAQTPTPVGNVSTTPITGLNNGTSYTFRVAAVNAVGTGAQSADSNPVTPVAPNSPPSAPTVNAPDNAATGIDTSATLDVGVSDPDANTLTVTYFGRPFASGNYVQIAQHSDVTSGTSDTASWSNLGAGQTFQWYVTISDGSLTTTGPTWTFHTVASVDPVFVGSGDIASCSVTGDTATGELIREIDGTIFTTGDNVYPNGTAAEFASCYATTPWGDGSVKSRTRPVPGNHDWGTGNTNNLDGYFGYYGANANASGTSYYSYDIPSSNWHVVNLDSECQLVPGGVSGDGCAANSAQEQWLELDLAANSGENVIAIWHKPRYSSGNTNYQALQPLWDDLYAAGVDILLVGHDHIYERLAPMKSGATLSSPPVADATFGIRQFTIGTGGEAHHGLATPLPTSQVRDDDTFGIFKLTLHASTYDWAFLPIAGSTFTDSGTGTVHGAPATVPGAPSIGTATAGNASATVTWSAPASNGGSAITGYVVTPFIGAVAQTPTPVGNVSTTPITGLNNGTSYTFRVAAVNAVGTGAQSADSNPVTPVAPATVPGAPSIGTATAGNASATVTWSAPASNGGSAITGYVVTPFIGAVAQTPTPVGNVSTTPITGLNNGTSYTFRVAAVNAVGTGAQSADSNPVTPVAPATVPGAPSIGTATAGNASATVTWSAPASNGGSAITGYVVTPFIGAVAQTPTPVGNVSTTPITGLNNGTSYTFRVAAVNAVGTGAQSADSNPVTPVAPATVPGAPSIGTATAGNASATVTWSAPASNGGSAITGYVVTPFIGAVAQTPTPVGNVSTTPITGLNNGTSYTFRVAAVNAVGTGAQSADSNPVTPVAPATVPGAPSIGTATAGNASATVTWSAPASNGGSAITGYVVTPFIGAVAQTPTPVGNVSTTPITGLNNGTSYTFRVAAVNAVGTGAQSADSNPVTPVAPATVPGAPSIGTATAGNASATVTWSAPASNGGSAITGYVVTPFIGAVAQTPTPVGNVSTTPITGLNNGTSYTFRVAAVNAVGTGAQSADSNPVTPVAPATVPGAPSIGTATAGNASATVTWSAPASNGGSAITGYVVTPFIGAVAQTPTPVGNVSTTPITGLNNGTSYTFRVAAVNAVGTGAQSADSNPVTPTTIVFRSSSVGQTRGNKGSVTLELAKPAGAVVGDVLIASIDLRGMANVSPPTTTTWTLVEAKRIAGSGSNALQKSTYWHTVLAGDPAVYSWSFSAVSSAVGTLVAYGGVNTTSSFAVGSQANTAATAVVAPTVTADTAGSRLVGFFTTATNATFTPPMGMAERCETLNSGSVKLAAEAADSILGGVGSTGSRTATASKSAVSIGQLIVLRPVP